MNGAFVNGLPLRIVLDECHPFCSPLTGYILISASSAQAPCPWG